MLNIKLSVAALAMVAAAALSACGGDSNDGGNSGSNGASGGSGAGGSNGASGGIPASALASVDGLMAFMADLIANKTDETSEPIDLGTAELPVDDANEVVS